MEGVKCALSVKFQPADLKQHILVSLVEQSMDQENRQKDRKGKCDQRKRLFQDLSAGKTQRLTAINTPNIQSFPVISGILMAAAIYINFVKGCTFVRYVPLSTNRLILFIYLFPGSCSEEQLHFLF